jgi:hypothetical protein
VLCHCPDGRGRRVKAHLERVLARLDQVLQVKAIGGKHIQAGAQICAIDIDISDGIDAF